LEATCVSTYLGHRFDPLERKIDVIALEDIAHGLAYQCRFNGQTKTFYSVAQHCLMVADLDSRDVRAAAQLHDAAEAYLGDMVKPLNALIPDYASLESTVSDLIADRFGVNFDNHCEIKQADLVALATEKRDLMPNSTETWTYLAGVEPRVNCLRPMQPVQAKRAYLQACVELGLS
jgi:uncharacterized protein